MHRVRPRARVDAKFAKTDAKREFVRPKVSDALPGPGFRGSRHSVPPAAA